MKRIQAIVKTTVVKTVVDALRNGGFCGYFRDEHIRGKGTRSPCSSGCSISCQASGFIDRAVIEVTICDTHVAEVCAIIEEKSGNGRSGSGKIFIIPIEDAVDISSGARGDQMFERVHFERAVT